MATLGSEQFRLRNPLPVEVSADDETVVAHSVDFEQYGAGDTDYEALDDLRQALTTSYSFLRDREAELGPHPRELLRRYRELVETTQ